MPLTRPTLLILSLVPLLWGCDGRATGEDASLDTIVADGDVGGDVVADPVEESTTDALDVMDPDASVDPALDADATEDPQSDEVVAGDAVDATHEPISCEGVEDCDGGPCSQGYCCDEECPGTSCARCDITGREGRCVRLSGNPCDDDDNCTLADRCDEGECVAGSHFCEGRPCENCLGEEWHVDLGDWCAELGGMPTCFCLCV